MELELLISSVLVVSGLALFKYSLKSYHNSIASKKMHGSRPGNNDGSKIVCEMNSPSAAPQTIRVG